MIALCCSECGKKLPASLDAAGKRIQCPSCGRTVSVPAARPSAVSHTRADAAPLPRTRLEPPPVELAGPEGASLLAAELIEFLALPQAPDEIGRLGPYRVLKILGAGGMGVVYEAEDPLLQRKVALKAMRPSLATSESSRQRFFREAKAVAEIEHDHIVIIHQIGEDRGIPFLTMPLLQGEALDERLRREPVLPLALTLRIGREVAEGLAAAHERGLIHRDIKPANIFLEGKRQRVKILDFGLARAVGEPSTLTQQGTILGTPAYMAPEQAAGAPVDHRCDLFSLGCVLYEMATGQPPFTGTHAVPILMAVALEEPVPPHERQPQVPLALSGLVMQLLAKKPEDRPQSAEVAVRELQAIEAALAAGPTLAAGAPLAPWQKWAWWILTAGIVLTLTAAGIAAFLLGH